MDNNVMKKLLSSQQGELDAVPMYLNLSKKADNPKLKAAFKQLAAEEGHHASVFFNLTKKELEPKQTKAILLPILQKILGWKILLKIIANAEYAAFDKYDSLIKDFPVVISVKNDEKRHGDILMSLIDEL